MKAARTAPGSHWLEPLCAWLAFAVPCVGVALRCEASSTWTGDPAMARALALLPAGGDGLVTGVLAPAMLLLPVGGRWLRVAALGAFAAGAAGLALFELTRRLLRANAATPVLGAALALAAAVMATLARSWQAAAAAPGSAALAVALGLGALAVAATSPVLDGRRLCVGGLLAALALGEHAGVGVVTLLGLGAALGFGPRALTRRLAMAVALGFGLGALLVALTLAVRAEAWLGWLGPASPEGAAGWLPDGSKLDPWRVAGAWQREIGPLPLVLAAGGALWGVARFKTRPLVLATLPFVLADTITRIPEVTTRLDAGGPHRLTAVGALAAAAALGVQTLALGSQRARLPFARPVAVLLVVLHFTFALVAAEDAAFAQRSPDADATEAWTDEAFAGLPPRAMVLARSEPTAWRLRAATLVRGERPDVIVVPLARAQRPAVARRLLAREPALAGLLRDLAVRGRPGEYALSTLADARPLYVEVDPRWDPRLFSHLTPGMTWPRFAPHALGRSDRSAGLEAVLPSLTRVLAAVGEEGRRGRTSTGAVVVRRIREQAAVLLLLGDHEAARRLLDLLGAEPATDPLAAAVAARASGRRLGPLDLEALLAR